LGATSHPQARQAAYASHAHQSSKESVLSLNSAIVSARSIMRPAITSKTSAISPSSSDSGPASISPSDSGPASISRSGSGPASISRSGSGPASISRSDSVEMSTGRSCGSMTVVYRGTSASTPVRRNRPGRPANASCAASAGSDARP
jgi:hypothetical protein